MDTISLIVAVILAFVAFDVTALLFGADSRDPLFDDHQR
jgi:hypothetical protein